MTPKHRQPPVAQHPFLHPLLHPLLHLLWRLFWRGLSALWLAMAPTLVLAQAPRCPPMPEPATEDAETSTHDHGMLWKLSRDGHSSYLFGSLHIGKAAWSQPGPLLRQALDASDAVALELDLSDPEVNRALSAAPAAPLKLSEALQKRMDAQARAACLPEGALAELHPLMQLSTYQMLAGRWDGLDPAYGQELMLMRWARRHERPLIGLEDVADQIDALIPDDPVQALTDLREGLTQLEKHQVRPMLLKLAGAWERGDLPTLARYEQWCDCIHNAADREALSRLNDGRNPKLAERIAALHARGQNLLAAVGALHMTGPHALPVLLRDQGFEVEPVFPLAH